MDRVSVLIEVDGREKLRLSLTGKEAKEFEASGNLTLTLQGFKMPDEGGKYGQFTSAEIDV